MHLVEIYECFCDETRLRILNLLREGELCVCHFQEILGEPQVKISKHLAYLRARGLVEARKEANWVIYRLPARPSRELAANLGCLQDCATGNAVFRKDSEKRGRLIGKFAECSPVCCGPKAGKKPAAVSP
jgi:ArsR family transcriptional regulator